MVPYSFTTSPLLKIKAAKTRFQNKPFSSSKRDFFFFWGERRCKSGEKGVRSEEEGERGVVWGKKFRFLRGFIFCLAHFFAILLIGYEIA